MTASALVAAARPLVDEHDSLLLDLDGVVQLDDQPIAHAPETLAEIGARGLPVVFVTNNAARSPQDVVRRLSRLHVDAAVDAVVTSAMVAAELLATRLAPGASVLVVGGDGLERAVADAGLQPVRAASSDVAAVVQGWGPDVDWGQLAEASIALRAGAPWLATNDDRTLPSPRGPLPGNGSLVAALSTATGLAPEVVGKPHPPLFVAAARHAGGTRPLFVGDRLDTDVAGALAAGIPALLVLTGVAQPADVLAAHPSCRPTYLGADLRALLEPHPPVTVADGEAMCGDAVVTAAGDVRTGANVAAIDALRAGCGLAWSGQLAPDRYGAVLRAIGLD